MFNDISNLKYLIQLPVILQRLGVIMTTVTELSAKLVTLDAQLSKVSTEINQKIDELTLALSTVALSPEAQAALDSLAAKVQLLDDICPDVEPTPVVEPVSTEPVVE